MDNVSHAIHNKAPPADHESHQTTPASLVLYSHNSTGAIALETSEGRIPQSELIQAVLQRYFMENLARWFDLCDPKKHFELTIPERARFCRPLMKAIFCSSARHLSRAYSHRSLPDIPDLRRWCDEFAVRFHTEAIEALLELTSDREALRDEDLLGAAILLRWHEEIDAPVRGDDQDNELFLSVIKIFINHQFVATPGASYSSPLVPNPMPPIDTSPNPEVNPASSYPFQQAQTAPDADVRLAMYWVAFRQEIYNCFLHQRSFHIPLSHCTPYRSSTPTDDVTWANRLIVFCADCIEFCYGSIEVEQATSPVSSLVISNPTAIRQRWHELKQIEGEWDHILPAGFEPIYCAPVDTVQSSPFPDIWYLADWHVTGLQHLELARILLVVHDPFRPRLGPERLARMEEMSLSLRAIVRKLCGMALGHQNLPPVMATACLAIAMCGDHFVDTVEQEGLLNILKTIEHDHGWPFRDVATRLRAVWGYKRL